MVTSISQTEAFAHGVAHLHLLRRAAVRPAELDGIAALQDAVEHAPPSLFAGRVVDAPRVEVRGDDHGLAGLVATVDDGVDVLHHVARVALRTQILDEQQVVGEDAVEFALAVVERLLHEAHDVADIRLERREPEVDDAVGYRRGHVRLAGADIPEQQEAVRVLRVEGRRVALAQGGSVGCLAVVRLEGAVPVEAARGKALLAHPLRLLAAFHALPLLDALPLLGLGALAGDGHDARAPEGFARQLHLLRRPAFTADEKAFLVAVIAALAFLRRGLGRIASGHRLVQFLHVLHLPFFQKPLRAVLKAFDGCLALPIAHWPQIAANPITLPCSHISTCRRSASPWRSGNRRCAPP